MNTTKQKSKITAIKPYEIEPTAENEVHKKGSKKSLEVKPVKLKKSSHLITMQKQLLKK